jgi:hypothetical protein
MSKFIPLAAARAFHHAGVAAAATIIGEITTGCTFVGLAPALKLIDERLSCDMARLFRDTRSSGLGNNASASPSPVTGLRKPSVQRRTPAMSERHRLLSRRLCETLGIQHNGTSYNVTVGTYADGALGGVFIDGPRIGSAVAELAHGVAVLVSIAMQYQVRAQVMAGAVARIETTNAAHTIAGAVLDLLVAEGAR